jgi:uncharacterized membrane protein YbhN (UPF0104 family)
VADAGSPDDQCSSSGALGLTNGRKSEPVDLDSPLDDPRTMPPDGTAKSSGWKIALRLGLTAALFALLFWQVRWQQVWDSVQSLDGKLFVWVCLLWIPTIYLQYVRWALLAREAGEGVSRGDIRRSFWVGFTLGLVTPGRVGQFGRALALHNCSLSRAMGLSAMERGYSAITINGFGLLALVLLPWLGWMPPYATLNGVAQGVLIVAGTFLLVLGVFPRSVFRPLNWIASKLPFRDKLASAIDVLKPAGPARGIVYLLLAAAGLASALLQFVLLLHAMHADVPVFAGMLAALLTFFLKGALPISVGSLGVGEWTAVYCFRGLGVEPSVSVAASLILFVLNVFIPSLIGLPFISTLRGLPGSKSKADTA